MHYWCISRRIITYVCFNNHNVVAEKLMIQIYNWIHHQDIFIKHIYLYYIKL